MAVEVFISWSGTQSRAIARELMEVIPKILGSVPIFMFDESTELGSHWDWALANHLDSSDVGIFVVTPANLRSRWMHFKAGAIAKHLDRSRAIPLLFGIGPQQLTGQPLGALQSAQWTGAAFESVMSRINVATGSRIDAKEVARRSHEEWPRINRKVTSIPGTFLDTNPLRYLLGDSGRDEQISLVFPIFTFDPELAANLSSEIREALEGLLRVLDDETFSRLFGKPGQRKGGEGVDDFGPLP